MAKLSSINKNNKRIKLSNKFFKKRQNLKKIVMNKNLTLEERFEAQQKLSKLPRNSSKTRIMNRCQIPVPLGAPLNIIFPAPSFP